MKRVIRWLIVALMAVAGANLALAEAVPEVPPAENPNVGYKGGFFVQNDDGSYKLTLKGRVQPIYQFQKRSGSAADSTFRLRRASLTFDGIIAKNGHVNFILTHSTSSAQFDTFNIFSITAGYKVAPEFDITVGTTGLPLTLLSSSSGLHFFDNPIVLTQKDGGAITPLRSGIGSPDGIGINFSGDIGKFSYEFGVVNGAAAPTPAVTAANPTPTGSPVTVTEASGGVESNFDLNFNKRVSVGARVAYNILDGVTPLLCDLPYSEKPKLTVSMGADYQGKRTDPTNSVVVNNILTGTVGAGFRWRGFAVTSEVFGRKTKIDDPGTTTWFSSTMDDFGYYLDSGYFVIPNKLEVGGIVSQIFKEGPNNNSYQFGGSLNWYILGNNSLKTQLVYTLSGTYSDVTNTRVTKSHYIGVGLNAMF